MADDPPVPSLDSAAETLPGAAPGDHPPGGEPDGPRYELEEEIARGGMGAVHAAWDAVLDREVAVKVLLADRVLQAGAVRRFFEEARITAGLQHPGVPPIHDLGVLPDGRPFLAMKLIRGRTLAALLAERAVRAGEPPAGSPQPPPASVALSQLLPVFETLCQTIAYAHANGVIHRDLKPSNVMVGEFGEVQVMDWGLARVLASRERERPEEEQPPVAHAPGSPGNAPGLPGNAPGLPGGETLTQRGQVLGTPAYMPPEQARGETDRVDRRADVFALGAILCQILTGDLVYGRGQPAEVLFRAATGMLDDALDRLDACGADAELTDLCKRCLAADPGGRPAHAGEVADALAAYRIGVEHRLQVAVIARAEFEAKAAEQRKRRRAQFALGLVVLLLGAVVVAAAWWNDRREQFARAEHDRQENGRRQAVTVALDQAEAALRADDGRTADTALTAAQSRLGAAGPDDLRERLAALTRDRAMTEALEFLIDGQSSPRLEELATRGLPLDHRSVRAFFGWYGLDLHAGDPADLGARIDRSPIRGQLLVGLELSLGSFPNPALNHDLNPAAALAVLRAADPDPQRNRVREALARGDVARLATLITSLDGADLPLTFAAAVGMQFRLPHGERDRLLAPLAERNPGYYPLRVALSRLPAGSPPGDVARALGHARVAVALRPRTPGGYRQLGELLKDTDRDAALAAYVRCLELGPRQFPIGTRRSIRELIEKWDGPAAAVAFFRNAAAAAPEDPWVHHELGTALRKAAGKSKADRGDLEPALAEFRRALELDPGEGKFYDEVGHILNSQQKTGEAVAMLREGRSRARHREWSTGNELGYFLRRQQKYREALAADEETLALFPWVGRMPLVGGYRPRHAAAISAVLAATDGGIDPPTDAERPALRKKAHDYLRAELDAVREQLPRDPDRYRREANQTMRRWLGEKVFDPVRNPAHLASLPPHERQSWEQLWADVERLRTETESPPGTA